MFLYVVVLGNHVFEEITCWSGVSYIMLFSFVLIMYVLGLSFGVALYENVRKMG